MNLYPLIAASGALEDNKGMLTLIVTVCGILMVFVALILLIVVISLFGKMLSNTGKSKSKKSKAAPAAEKAAPAAPAVKAAPAAAPVASSNGIPDEIIAVIAAAVAAMDDGAYVIRSVRRSKEGRPAWSMAGIYENTRPF